MSLPPSSQVRTSANGGQSSLIITPASRCSANPLATSFSFKGLSRVLIADVPPGRYECRRAVTLWRQGDARLTRNSRGFVTGILAHPANRAILLPVRSLDQPLVC